MVWSDDLPADHRRPGGRARGDTIGPPAGPRLRKATSGGRPAMELWQDLYDPTVFFVGRSDDLNVLQYGETIDAVYGEGVAATDFVDETKLDTFIALADQLPPPKILGMVIMDTDDEEATTKGLRFMGQRFVPDAYIFRQLIYRNVGTQADRARPAQRPGHPGRDGLGARLRDPRRDGRDRLPQLPGADGRGAGLARRPDRRGLDRDALQLLALHLLSAPGGARGGISHLHAVRRPGSTSSSTRCWAAGPSSSTTPSSTPSRSTPSWAADRRHRHRCRRGATSSRCRTSTRGSRRSP